MNADTRRSTPLIWAPLILIALALGLRWMKLASPGTNLLPNIAPWMALAFTGTLVFPKRLPWLLWPLLLLAIDVAALGSQLWTMADSRLEVFTVYALYAAAAWLGGHWRGRVGILRSLLGVVACGAVFYVVSNTLCWWVKPYYSKDLAGLIQALTTGLPGFPPTWTFFRSSLLSDLGFSALLLVAFHAEARLRFAPQRLNPQQVPA